MVDTIIFTCRLYVIFVAASGFLFGQLFFANFDLAASIAGVFGLLSGGLSGQFVANSRSRAYAVLAFCFASLVGVAFDAHHYYAHLDIPGNYYAWIMIGPYCVCMLVIAWAVATNVSTKSIRGTIASARQAPAWTKFGVLEFIPGIRDLSSRQKALLTLFAVLLIMLFNLYNAGVFSR